ncbi:MAG: ChaN family lipoprotein [Elusimicrobia bacterium]|nr:ChaN family lipoprotein [Elusimicrobiota bacterium]
MLPLSALFLSCAASAAIYDAGSARLMDEGELWARLQRAKVAYVGERHDNPLDHELQLMALDSAFPGNGVTLGLEMLEASHQPTLDQYLARAIDDQDFARFWEKAWGFPFELYRPILERARDRRIPVKALNAPAALVRKVARCGLASLSPEERKRLPARIHPTQDSRYRDWVEEQLKRHGSTDPKRLERMLEAMAVWNNSMAESALGPLGDGHRVLILAGFGHVMFKAGIAESLRLRDSTLEQSVLINYPQDEPGAAQEELLRRLREPEGPALWADYFWLRPLPGSALGGDGLDREPRRSGRFEALLLQSLEKCQ